MNDDDDDDQVKDPRIEADARAVAEARAEPRAAEPRKEKESAEPREKPADELPEATETWRRGPEGLSISPGVTGSGKRPTSASMLAYATDREPLHILTAEDPVEFTFPANKASINQREIGLDSRDWHKALK